MNCDKKERIFVCKINRRVACGFSRENEFAWRQEEGEADKVGQALSASVGELYVVLVISLDDRREKKLQQWIGQTRFRSSGVIIYLEAVLLDLQVEGFLGDAEGFGGAGQFRLGVAVRGGRVAALAGLSFQRLQALPGFRSEVVIEAGASVLVAGSAVFGAADYAAAIAALRPVTP